MPSTTTFGSPQRVFRGGDSSLLNHVARLSVLYEDFRIEYAAMPLEDGRLGELDTFGNSYPLITYYGGLRTRLLNFREA